VRLGDSIPDDPDFLEWAEIAILAAGDKRIFPGNTSSYWYDSDSFFELMNAAGLRTVRDVMQDFDGCSRFASSIATDFIGRAAASLTRDETDKLLTRARSQCQPSRPERLTLLRDTLSGSYAYKRDKLVIEPGRGLIAAELPYTVEAWCNVSADGQDHITILVNRTPVTNVTEIRRQHGNKTEVAIFGCQLSHGFKVGRKPVELVLNVQIPHMPITSNGKEPNLRLIVSNIHHVICLAAKRCQRANPTAKKEFQNRLILDNLARAIGHASGQGKYRFSLRQLFYAVRPYVIEAIGAEPGYDWFSKVIATYETEQGHDIHGLYRDDRGVLYHPHLRAEMPLGTLAVESYKRPPWTFNKVLYCEKEGFFTILRDANWPELNDCALLTSKGQATKAAKDLIDLMGETTEPLYFFCAHDADAYGTTIFQALQDATRSRPGRKVKIINLGLEPAEAVRMGLPVENVQPEKNGKRKPVANYVGARWSEWLQRKRAELNAMTTPQFIAWLTRKLRFHCKRFGIPFKVIPPTEVIAAFLAEILRSKAADALREQILREAGFEARTNAAVAELGPSVRKVEKDLSTRVEAFLSKNPADWWRTPIEQLTEQLVGKGHF
jgi:hypothetical protein